MVNLGWFLMNLLNMFIIVYVGKVLVCCEGGASVAIDSASFATRGEVVFGLSFLMGFSVYSK